MDRPHALRFLRALAPGLLLAQGMPAPALAQEGCYAWQPREQYFECVDNQGCSSSASFTECSGPSQYGYMHCTCGVQMSCCGAPYWDYSAMPCGYYCIKPSDEVPAKSGHADIRRLVADECSSGILNGDRIEHEYAVSNNDAVFAAPVSETPVSATPAFRHRGFR